MNTTWSANFNRYHTLIPNFLSLFRGVLGCILPFLLLSPGRRFHLFAVAVFALAAMTDHWDGWYARRYNIVSDFGKIIDPTVDKILIQAPLITFALLGYYSIWWIVPIFAREFVITFCRIGWLQEGKALGAEKLGKIKFGFQVALISFSLFYQIAGDFRAPVLVETLLRFAMMASLIFSLGITVLSGISFLRSNRQNFQGEKFARFTSALGVGLIPFVPGTLGSLFGLGLILLVRFNTWLYLGTFLFLFGVGYWAVSQLDLTRDKDPGFVVVDEALGMMVALFAIPLGFTSYVTGFFLFRLFDILKPYPLRRLEDLPGYWGILSDDLGAGIYSWLILFLIFR